MNDDSWGPWIQHTGDGCPCVGQYGQFVSFWGSDRETVSEGIAGLKGGRSWDWSNWPAFTMIVRYRIRKPAALQTLLNIAASPAPMHEELEV